MSEATCYAENDPSLAKLRLRKEVSSSLRENNGKRYVLIHDELNSRFFRLGINEWKIVRFFDGTRTLRQAMRDAAEQLGLERVSPAEVSRLASWLVQNGLAECRDGSLDMASAAPAPGNAWYQPLARTASLGRWNPLFLKVTLPNPRRVLHIIFPLLSWFFSRNFFPVWLLVVGIATFRIVGDWSDFRSSWQDVFASENWLYLLVVWILLKVFHETGHAIACMRFGGNVTRCGLMFILFSPIAWVDVTSSWSFRSKWQRIFVSAAGMYVEFFIAAVAALIWSQSKDPAIETLARNIVFSASITTLLFNLNFLMRFDGYYILSDLLEIQNLYQAGQQYVQYIRNHYLLGTRAICPNFSRGKLAIVGCYGVAALLWRILFCIGILIVAAQLFRGAGIVLALLSGIFWFGIPLVQFVLIAVYGVADQKPKPARLASAAAALTAAIAMGLMMPWPGQTLAPGVVEFSPLQPIRVDSPGFVDQVDVRPGQAVAAGQLLLKLRNPELRRESADLELQIQSQQIAQRVARQDNELARCEAIGKKLDSLKEQLLQSHAKLASLEVRAPIAGNVLARDLTSLTGKYIESGTELLAIGSTGAKEVRISIRQQDVSAFRKFEHSEVSLGIRGHSLDQPTALLERVHPRATRHVLHPGLSATNGGPLAVQQNSNAESQEGVLLVEPRFEGLVSVSRDASDELHAGEICRVSLGRGHRRVYQQLWSLARTYLHVKSGQRPG